MVELLRHKDVLSRLKAYYDRLAKTGYVPEGTVKRLTRYLFLVDFVDCMYTYLTEEDYRNIEELLSALFGGGDCLLPYPVFCSRRAVVGMPNFIGTALPRITETASAMRNTEDDNFRTA